MSVVEQIDSDLKAAMKSRDSERTQVLRSLKSALRNAAIEKGGASATLDDPEAIAVLRKQAKQREDSIQSFTDGGRDDLADKEKSELEIIQSLLPAQLSADEITKLVAEVISETGADSLAQMGAVMKELQQRAAGRADGRMLSGEVKRQLG